MPGDECDRGMRWQCLNYFLVGRSFFRHQKAQVAQRSAFREYKIWANMGKEQKLFNK